VAALRSRTRKYSRGASKDVEGAMPRRQRGTLREWPRRKGRQGQESQAGHRDRTVGCAQEGQESFSQTPAPRMIYRAIDRGRPHVGTWPRPRRLAWYGRRGKTRAVQASAKSLVFWLQETKKIVARGQTIHVCLGAVSRTGNCDHET
jgi:hypothetical protein